MEKKFSVKQKQIMKFKSLIQKFKNLLNVIGVNIPQIIETFSGLFRSSQSNH